MPKIVYLDAFPADNALDILKPHAPGLEVVRIDRNDPVDRNFATLADAHAYQCVPARDEVGADPGLVGQRAERLLIVGQREDDLRP